MTEPTPSDPRQALADLLRAVRERAHLTIDQLADRAGLQRDKVSRLQLGKQLPTDPDLTAWLQATEAPDGTAAEAARLLDLAKTSAETWRKQLKTGRVAIQQRIEKLQRSARLIRYYLPTAPSGLLQTPGYARAIMTGDNPYDAPGIEEAIAVRLGKQQMLYETDSRGRPLRRFHFVLDERVLRWPPYGDVEVLRGQLDRLRQLQNGLAHVTAGIVPFAVPAPLAMHSFAIYSERTNDEASEVVVELHTAELTVRDPEDVAIYETLFGQLADAAVTGDEAVALINRIDAELRGQGA